MFCCADIARTLLLLASLQAKECWINTVAGVWRRYHFVTTTCAIIGGVFTVAGIVDGLVHTGARFAKKVELGKHT